MKFEHDAYARIKSAEIVGHSGDVEVGTLREGRSLVVRRNWVIGTGIVVRGNDLLQESIPEQLARVPFHYRATPITYFSTRRS